MDYKTAYLNRLNELETKINQIKDGKLLSSKAIFTILRFLKQLDDFKSIIPISEEMFNFIMNGLKTLSNNISDIEKHIQKTTNMLNKFVSEYPEYRVIADDLFENVDSIPSRFILQVRNKESFDIYLKLKNGTSIEELVNTSPLFKDFIKNLF